MADDRVLYIVAGAAPPVLDIASLLVRAKAGGWSPCLTLTPNAARWLADTLPALEAAAGRPIRTHDRLPTEPRPFPQATALLACPLTFNSLNKWALGISDNTALGTFAEALGSRLPTVAMPYFKSALAANPATPRSLRALEEAGVHLLPENGLTADGCGGYDWDGPLEAVRTLVG